MSVLVIISGSSTGFKKTAFEAVSYGSKTADLLNQKCVVAVLGKAVSADQLGIYGATRVIQVDQPQLDGLDSQVYTRAISQIAEAVSASTVILPHSSFGKSLAGRLSVRMNAGLVSGVNSIPDIADGFTVRKNVFSGKAIATVRIDSEQKILTLMGNSISPEAASDPVSVETMALDLAEPKVITREVKTVEGTVPLPEAELVVSAGRGMKAAENWGIIEELANVLGATTACSRPVADTGWRPHHEHVGQTGIAIRPNLYIAIGISGAIQHLAGVNNSKTIVVINKDPEAPFFKAADYGICADLFDVVPVLTNEIRKLKENN